MKEKNNYNQIRKRNNPSNQIKKPSKSSQAFKLLLEGKTPVKLL